MIVRDVRSDVLIVQVLQICVHVCVKTSCLEAATAKDSNNVSPEKVEAKPTAKIG